MSGSMKEHIDIDLESEVWRALWKHRAEERRKLNKGWGK